MAAIVPVILEDDSVTPAVNRTYTPRGKDANGVHAFRNVSTSGVPFGDPLLTVGLRRTATKYIGTIQLTVPVLVTETINGVMNPRVTRTARFKGEFTVDGLSTKAERASIVAQVADALAGNQTLIQSLLVDLEDIYA